MGIRLKEIDRWDNKVAFMVIDSPDELRDKGFLFQASNGVRIHSRHKTKYYYDGDYLYIHGLDGNADNNISKVDTITYCRIKQAVKEFNRWYNSEINSKGTGTERFNCGVVEISVDPHSYYAEVSLNNVSDVLRVKLRKYSHYISREFSCNAVHYCYNLPYSLLGEFLRLCGKSRGINKTQMDWYHGNEEYFYGIDYSKNY